MNFEASAPLWTTVNAALVDQGTLSFQGSCAVASGFTNSGAIELTSAGGSQAAILTVTGGTLVNASGRTISALAAAAEAARSRRS